MGSEKKILVVEDNPDIRGLYEKIFAGAGYEVRSAGSAEEALEIIKGETMHVMFFDLELPGMSGLELCKRIRGGKHFAIIHAVTGHAVLHEFTHCREAGFDDYFVKPVDRDKLLLAARQAFEKINRWKKGSSA